MTHLNRLAALAASILSIYSVHAQTIPNDLLQAARKAVESNPEVQARWRGFLAAGEERDVARGGYLPQVDLRAGVGRENRVTPLVDYGTYSFGGTQVTINQMLFDGLFTPSEVKRLGYAKLTRYYELSEAAETSALEALRAYADVVRYRELVEMARQNYVEHRQTAALVEERANSGVGRRVDVEQAMGRLALAESNLLTELTNLHDVSARYLRIVGEKPGATLAPLPEKFAIAPLPASPSAVMQEGLPNSPALNAAFENVRAARTAIETRKAAYLPRLDLRGYSNRDRTPLGVDGRQRVNGVELVLSYNLFRGGADMAREKQAVQLHEQARDLQEKVCRDVRQNLSISYSDVNRLNEQMRYLDQHRLSTEKANAAYRQQFELGQRTLLDLLDSQNEYFQAARAYTNARYDQVVAQARTLSGMGRLVASLNVSRADMPAAQDAGQDRTGFPADQLCPVEEDIVASLDKIRAETVIPPRARPAPPPPSPQTTRVTLSADALFDFDKAGLKPGGTGKLDDLVNSIKGANVEVIVAMGHTDSIGTEAYNQKLSLARAEAVKAYLVSKGIDGKLIRTEGRGESQPVASNATAEGRSLNRRVEIEVTEARPAAR